MAFKVSVVMAAYNSERYISEAIESIVNQSLDFHRNIQLIIIDDASSDYTYEVANYYAQKYPKNILVLRNDKNYGPSYSRNRGLGHVQGEFVNFLDSDDYITEYTFSKAMSFFKKHKDVDVVSIPIYYFGSRRGEHSLNFKYKKTQVIDLMENPEYIQLSGASSFFRFSILQNYQFKETLNVSEDPLLINQMLLDNPKIGFIEGCGYYYRKHDTGDSLIGSSVNHKSYFTTRVDDYFFGLVEYALERYDEVPKFIQHVIMYDLQWIFEVKRVSHLLNKAEIIEFYAKLIKLLSYIDTDVILYQKLISGALKAHILIFKKYNVKYLSNKDCLEEECKHVEELKLNHVHIDICQVHDDKLYILGYLTTFTLNPEIKVILNDSDEIDVTPLEFPQRVNMSLNFDYGFNHHFEVSIPLEDGLKIAFRIKEYDLIPKYDHISRLSKVSGYLLSRNYLVIDMDDHIGVKKISKWNVFKQEFKTLKRMLGQRKEGWRTGVLLRVLFYLTYPIYNDKRLWLFMDLPYLADDNAFQLFKYAVERNDSEIEKYFAIEKENYDAQNVEIMANKYRSSSRWFKIKSLLGFGRNTSGEYQKISDIGFEIAYRSLKHRLYSLYAEAIISSNPDNNIIYPFWGNFPFLSGLIRSKTIFLQHGVTKDNVSSWLNKYDKNIDLLVTVSDDERQSFLDAPYGYGEDVVKVLGFPRFDILECKEDKREVVIMPTWRRHYNNFTDEYFVRTTFFKRFNALLNDEELIEFLDSEGYTLVFKPHINLFKFLHLFDIHDDVEFADDDYSDIFNHSSLLITDYSSVAFDFAYLEKPVIYYQYGNDYHFDVESAYFDYETMGFGPIAKTHEELKNEIIAQVLNECEMDDEYKVRVESFFKFRDKENSKRVYDAIKEMDFDY